MSVRIAYVISTLDRCGTDDFAQQVHSDLLDFSKNLRQSAVDKGAALRAKLEERRAEQQDDAPTIRSSEPTQPKQPTPGEPQAYVP